MKFQNFSISRVVKVLNLTLSSTLFSSTGSSVIRTPKKMNNLKGTENSHGVLPTVVDADYSEDATNISDFKELFLSTPESIKIFQRWYSKQNDLDDVGSFLNKLKFFSLKAHLP